MPSPEDVLALIPRTRGRLPYMVKEIWKCDSIKALNMGRLSWSTKWGQCNYKEGGVADQSLRRCKDGSRSEREETVLCCWGRGHRPMNVSDF